MGEEGTERTSIALLLRRTCSPSAHATLVVICGALTCQGTLSLLLLSTLTLLCHLLWRCNERIPCLLRCSEALAVQLGGCHTDVV